MDGRPDPPISVQTEPLDLRVRRVSSDNSSGAAAIGQMQDQPLDLSKKRKRDSKVCICLVSLTVKFSNKMLHEEVIKLFSLRRITSIFLRYFLYKSYSSYIILEKPHHYCHIFLLQYPVLNFRYLSVFYLTQSKANNILTKF